MDRQRLADLTAFVGVARERSFTRAAAKLGVTPSALSHRMRALEEGLGIRLLNRTTRSVTVTEAGDRLLASVGARLDAIDADLAALSELRDRPAGTVRINADEIAVSTVLWPAIKRLLPDYPDIVVELHTDNELVDIVAQGFDAGVRLGDIIDKDMIAIPISPPMRMVAVASPAYFARRGRPVTLKDLTDHDCINLRLATYGGLYAWEFEDSGRPLNVRVDGPLIFNSVLPILDAVVDGCGIAYLMEHQVQPFLDDGKLEVVLGEWSPPFAGFHLYYPSRRQPTPAFAIVAEALRYRGG